jgi:hypothetical protein
MISIAPQYQPGGAGPAPVPTNATYTFAPVHARHLMNVRYQVTAANTSTPVYTFKLQGSEDPLVAVDIAAGTSTATWTDLTLPAGSVHGTTADLTFTGPAVSASWAGANALNMLINVSAPPTWVRLVATRTSGGSATASMLARIGARSQGGG